MQRLEVAREGYPTALVFDLVVTLSVLCQTGYRTEYGAPRR